MLASDKLGTRQFTSARPISLTGLAKSDASSALSESKAVKEQAATFFREAQDKDLLIGRSIEDGAAAAVYAACRCNGLVTMETVADVARCSDSHIWNCYRTFLVELDLPIPYRSRWTGWRGFVRTFHSTLPRRFASGHSNLQSRQLSQQRSTGDQTVSQPALCTSPGKNQISGSHKRRSASPGCQITTARQWFQEIEEHIVA